MPSPRGPRIKPSRVPNKASDFMAVAFIKFYGLLINGYRSVGCIICISRPRKRFNLKYCNAPHISPM